MLSHLAEVGVPARRVSPFARDWPIDGRQRSILATKFPSEAHAPKPSIATYVREGSILSLFTAPVVYSLLIPFALVDLWVSVFQWICFPIYGIPRVPRRSYLVVDRHNLSYLNGIERINCVFCGYANGVIAFVREVGARTEEYWCPIKHRHAIFDPHGRYERFFGYGDAENYRRGLGRLRSQMRRERARPHP